MPGAAQPCRAGRAACGALSCRSAALGSPTPTPTGLHHFFTEAGPRRRRRSNVQERLLVPGKEVEGDELPASVCPTSAGAQSPPPAANRRVKHGAGGL